MAPAQEGKCVLRKGAPHGKENAHGHKRTAIRHRDRAHRNHPIERGEGRRGLFRHAERPCRRRLRRLPCRRRRGTHLEGGERFQPSGEEEGGRAQEGGVDHYKVEVVSPILRYGDIERYRKSSAPFAARELSPTTAAASTSTSTPRHTRPRRCARSPTSWPARRTFSTAPSGLSGAASSYRYANRTPSKRCLRNAATSESRLSRRRETWDFDMDDTPRAPPPPRPCAWRCRARTSRPPRRRARGPPGSSALKTEVSF